MIYVLNEEGKPLMPCSNAKCRRLLKNNKAIIVRRNPFTIKLTFSCENITQETCVGIDSGSKFVGISVTTIKQELFNCQVYVRDEISNLMAKRKIYRNKRRYKLRYRKERFLNRKNQKEDWLAPSIRYKKDLHIRIVEYIKTILPISKINIEIGAFNIEKINDTTNFLNRRAYIFHRDCGCVNCGSFDRLQTHHLASQKFAGDSINNLVSLCKICHNKIHNGSLVLKTNNILNKITKHKETINLIRKPLIHSLKMMCKDITVCYGYETSEIRKINNIKKTHINDAFCITKNIKAKRLDFEYVCKPIRRHNRQIHLGKIKKGNKRLRNQCDYKVNGFRSFDMVVCKGYVGFIYGRRKTGYFDIRKIDGCIITGSISHKKLIFLDRKRSMIFQKNVKE